MLAFRKLSSGAARGRGFISSEYPWRKSLANPLPTGRAHPGHAERRRAIRLPVVVPIEVEWEEPDGTKVNEQARAKNISVNGALLQMHNFPARNTEVSLRNILCGESVKARIGAIRRTRDGKLSGVVVELLEGSETFWGLTFQLQHATEQLAEIEKALPQHLSDVDFRVLRSLREAVEELRRTTGAVQQWQELALEGKSAYSVLEHLSSARVDRATHLLHDLTADMDACELSTESKDFENLARAVERLYERMTRGPATVRDSG